MGELKLDIINMLERYAEAMKIVDPILHFHSIRTGYVYKGPMIYSIEAEKLIERIKNEWTYSLERG